MEKTRIVLALCVLFVSCFSTAIADDSLDSDITLLGRWQVGSCMALDVEGDLACYADGAFLQTADVSDPYAPVTMGGVLLPMAIWGMDVVGSMAYVADFYYGLQIVDVSKPATPILVGACETGDKARAVVVQDKYAYLADSEGCLRIVDVSDPRNPYEVGCLNEDGFPQDLDIRQEIVYLATWDGVYIIDVSNAEQPNHIRTIEPGNYYGFEGVVFHGDYAYVSAGQGGLHVYDVTDLAHPTLAGYYNAYGNVVDMGIHGDLGVVVCRGSGLRVVDISDPPYPIELCHYDTPHANYEVECNEQFAFTASFTKGMRILDLEDPTSPSEAGVCETGGGAYGILVRDGIAYVAEGWTGLRTIDVSDPTDPSPIGLCRVDDNPKAIDLIGDQAYVAAALGVRIFDVSDPAEPYETGFYAIESGATDIAVRDNLALTVNYDDGLTVLDVSDPSSIEPFSGFPLLHPQQVVIGDTYAYVAVYGEWGYDGALAVVDYTVPDTSEIVAMLEFKKTTHVATYGDFAYIYGQDVNHDYGLHVVDVADPAEPVHVGFLGMNLPIFAIAATEDYVYLGQTYTKLLMAVDVREPKYPVVATSYSRDGYHTSCIFPQDELIYTNGVWIFRNDLMTTSAPEAAGMASDALTSYPNPFNPTTVISYSLSSPSDVRLGIYDVSGRLVSLLKDGVIESAGPHSVRWQGVTSSGSGAASGTYFCRLEAGAFQATHRLVLIR